MNITVTRAAAGRNTTLSEIAVDGAFVCYGLEDKAQKLKIKGKTRIPAGEYCVKLRKEGGFHSRYKERFASHKGMLHIQNVTGFEYILIHCGNTHEDTEGCLLVGAKVIFDDACMDFELKESAVAYTKLYNKVVQAAEAGNLTINFIDN